MSYRESGVVRGVGPAAVHDEFVGVAARREGTRHDVAVRGRVILHVYLLAPANVQARNLMPSMPQGMFSMPHQAHAASRAPLSKH